MSLPTITTAERLDRCLSSFGVLSFADHDTDGNEDTSVASECIEYGISEVIGPLSQYYEVANLSNVPVLGEYATIVAARTLCTRRGNPIPESLELRYQEITAEGGLIDRISKNRRKMTDSNGVQVPQKAGRAPMHANLTVDRRFPERRIRVVDGQSNMADTALRRDVDRSWSNE